MRYSDRVIYSPGVPVFRADDGALLDEPYAVSFLTAAAPQPRRDRGQPADGGGHRKLVLGAWGCGVFRNDPAVVAAAFAALLARARGRFDHVIFAVLDRQRGTAGHAAFSRACLPAQP